MHSSNVDYLGRVQSEATRFLQEHLVTCRIETFRTKYTFVELRNTYSQSVESLCLLAEKLSRMPIAAGNRPSESPSQADILP